MKKDWLISDAIIFLCILLGIGIYNRSYVSVPVYHDLDLAELQAINNDVVGIISSDDFEEPVLLNAYEYQDHTYKHKNNTYGSTRMISDDMNIILSTSNPFYKGYVSKEYIDEHRSISFNDQEYQIISVFQTETPIMKDHWSDDHIFLEEMKQIKGISLYETPEIDNVVCALTIFCTLDEGYLAIVGINGNM